LGGGWKGGGMKNIVKKSTRRDFEKKGTQHGAMTIDDGMKVVICLS